MLAKSPESLSRCVQPVRFTESARTAFGAILEGIDFSAGKKLLLPAYIGITDREGSGVMDPVLETGTAYEFYALDKSLAARKTELHRLIKSEAYKALLIIHYFGFCQNDMQEIRELCSKHGVLLIEDCAHTMYSEVAEGKLGTIGDFSFYSIHKFLATSDGGCLRVNNQDFLSLLQDPTLKAPGFATLDMLARADLEEIRAKRRTNYLELLKLIKNVAGIDIMYAELPAGIAPHNFPILVKNDRREPVYFKLIEAGVPVIALYYRLIDAINEGDYQDAMFLSQNILNLPVHQDIEIGDLEFIAQKLRESLLDG